MGILKRISLIAPAIWAAGLAAALWPGLLVPILIADLALFILLFMERKRIPGGQYWLVASLLIPLLHLELASTADAAGHPDRYYETEQERNDRWRILDHTDLARNHTPGTLSHFRLRSMAPVQRSGWDLVIALGSSSTYGEGVEPEQAWPEMMRRYLEESGPELTVLNAGISGYNLFQLWLYARDVLMRFRPDMVILVYGANEGITESAKTWYAKTRGALEKAALPRGGPRAKAILYGTTNLTAIGVLDITHKSFAVRRLIRRMKFFNHAGTPRVDGANPQPPYEPRPPYLKDILKSLVFDVTKAGAILLLVAEPSNRGAPASPPVAEEMRRAAEGNDRVGFLDISDEFSDQPADTFLDFVHPNVRGHQVIGNRLAREVEKWLRTGPEK